MKYVSERHNDNTVMAHVEVSTSSLKQKNIHSHCVVN